MSISVYFGVGGGSLVLLSYLAVAFGWRWSPFATNLCSALGALGLCIHLAERAAIPPLVLNAIWFFAGCIAVVRSFRDGRAEPSLGRNRRSSNAEAALEKLQALGVRPGMDVDTLRALTLRPMGEELKILSFTHDAVTGDDEVVFLNVMRANAEVAPHRHRSAQQVEYVVSGQVRFELNGNVRTLTAGEWLCVPARSSHTFSAVSGPAVVASVAYGGVTPIRFWLAWHGSPPYFALSIEEQVRAQHDLNVLADTEWS
jgi:quercetin dioxygenase-like cupin family protein